MDKIKKLNETMRMLMEGKFSGHIKINFSQGSIGRIEKTEEFDESNIVAVNNALKQMGAEKSVQHEMQ
jgi:hypothetical protein